MPYPSKPSTASAEASHGPYMAAEEAIAILSKIWTPNVRMWKYRGCQLGDEPRQWPPRILAALAVLAQTAGPANRIRAMQMISIAMGNMAYTTPTPEHISRATELIKAVQHPQQPQAQQQHGGTVNYSQHPVINAVNSPGAALPAAVKSEAAGTAAGDEKDKEIAALRASMVKMKKEMMQKDLRVDEAEMKWFNMDATFAVMTADRDMHIMHFDVAEMHRKRLEKEKAAMASALSSKDLVIGVLTRQRDEAVANAADLEMQLATLKDTTVLKDDI
ncbi:hypothetical protein SLS58_006710 [Diplodia intermedia]|uniref:Uncharacterized protein n=1 Tax=Diplodia intermedia TaxID=856260 RepID=A0ABR3TM86_9PEZI